MPLIRNLPSPEGADLGRELARLCDGAAAQRHADGRPVPKRCGTCAFRAGSEPNGCAPTVMDALKCALEQHPFRCHEDGLACRGWLLLRTEAPRQCAARGRSAMM